MDYARFNHYVRNQVLSEIEKEKLNKEKENQKQRKMGKSQAMHECNGHHDAQKPGGALGQAMDIMKEVNAMFFKKTRNLKKIRDDSEMSGHESSSHIETDSSMSQFEEHSDCKKGSMSMVDPNQTPSLP